jgi:hypothetical protein
VGRVAIAAGIAGATACAAVLGLDDVHYDAPGEAGARDAGADGASDGAAGDASDANDRGDALPCAFSDDAATLPFHVSGGIFGLAADDEGVFFTDQGSDGGVVYACAPGMQTCTLRWFTSVDTPTTLGVGRGWVVWAGGPTGQDRLGVRRRDGGDLDVSRLMTNGRPTAILVVPAAGDERVFWVENGGKIRRCDVATCDSLQSDFADGGPSPSSLVTDGTYVYWSSGGLSAEIVRCGVGGCSPVATLDAGQSGAVQLAVRGPNLYWADDKGRIGACTLPDCTNGRTLTFNGGRPTSLAVDECAVYWTDGLAADAGRVARCELPTCTSIVTLAANQILPARVALDGQRVYWTAAGGKAGAGVFSRAK